MSLQEKMIVALLDSALTKDDFLSKKFSGFFNSDINNPQLDNNVFLLFEYKIDSESIDRDKRLLASPNLYKSEFVKIAKNDYVLYTFTITNPAIKHIMDNSMIIPDKDLITIYKFWNFCDKEMNRYTITNKINELFKDSQVPEFDYIPTLEDVFGINK